MEYKLCGKLAQRLLEADTLLGALNANAHVELTCEDLADKIAIYYTEGYMARSLQSAIL